ncbi:MULTISPECIES: beta-ketoacyl-ACP synthase III [unclassified Phycicoccus]|uniref:beta-ketoacyl-ACP synthase III n=1 Tax=unclassified Phycicoccus TaxID=2637926 RepID=UPI00070388DA|nr:MULTISPECIES: beta-ketoacyl-ACP synthase III [unclassified Phycicoccus]KQU66320.1 3-oxoacyl-ACP synthase [Phycicoccus sp. Root101]KQZ87468.1 3-oxoacyl-ACP synthase [Phycicoccus sp. Root563]
MTTPAPKGTGTITAPAGATFSRILGVGGYRPERVVWNAELVEAIDSSDEWIQERSGIKSRRFAAKDESVVDMSVAASHEALAMAGLEASAIDAVIVATVTHPFQTPAAAPIVADRLGIQAAAFDISAACAGYCHAISLASDMVRGGSARHVLVIGVEKLSDFTDLNDRGSAFIFGDGAGAAIVGPSDTPAIGPTVWGSDGAQWKAISQRDSWVDVRDQDLGWPAIGMAGQTVFRWAVWGMAPVALKALDAAGVRPEDLDAFIPHQANMRIIDAMIKQLKLPSDIAVARDIADTANTSAASVPLATERMLREGEAPRGGLALQIGFGAGLVYAAQVIVLP